MFKEKLVAAAAAAVLTAPAAFAQTVSIYGIADIGVSYLDFKQTGTKSYLVSDAGYGGSRLGFNMQHDLGGNLKVKANFEGGLSLDNSLYGNLFYTRQAWVGLSGDFGTVVGGQDYSLSFLTAYRGEYCGWCGISSPAAMTRQGVRTGDYIKYTSPDFGGFSVGVGHSFGGSLDSSAGEATTVGAGQSKPSSTEVAAFYTGGPVNAAASYRTRKNLTGESVKDYYLAGNVGFGPVKVYALLGAAQSNEPTKSVDEVYTNVGLGYKLGDTDLNLQYGRTKDKAAAASDNVSQLVAVSVFHPLDKSTTVFAHVASIKNDANVSRQPYIGSGSVPTAPAGKTVSGLQFGLRYVF
jgi:predicted porin